MLQQSRLADRVLEESQHRGNVKGLIDDGRADREIAEIQVRFAAFVGAIGLATGKGRAEAAAVLIAQLRKSSV